MGIVGGGGGRSGRDEGEVKTNNKKEQKICSKSLEEKSN